MANNLNQTKKTAVNDSSIEAKTIKVVAVKKTVKVQMEECSEVVLLENESILNETKEIISEVDKRYAELGSNSGENVLDLDGRFEKVITNEINHQADLQSLAKLDEIEKVLFAAYDKIKIYQKGNPIIEKLILNLNSISKVKTRLNNIQQLRDCYNGKVKSENTQDEELSLTDAAEIIERTAKAEEAKETIQEMNTDKKNKRFIVYGSRDKKSVFDFYEYNNDRKRTEFITTEQKVQNENRFLENRRENLKKFEEEVNNLVALDVDELLKNKTTTVYHSKPIILSSSDDTSIKNVTNDELQEESVYIKESAIGVAEKSMQVLDKIAYNTRMIEHLNSKLNQIDLKMKKKKFPSDIKYRDTVVQQIDFLKSEIDKMKELSEKLDKKLDEINNHKTETKNESKPEKRQDILSKFNDIYKNNVFYDFKLNKIDKIFNKEMQELYSQMQDSVEKVNSENLVDNKNDGIKELISKTPSDEDIENIVSDPSLLLKLMKIAMDGKSEEVDLNVEQKNILKRILDLAEFELSKQNKKDNEKKEEKKLNDIVVEAQPGEE